MTNKKNTKKALLSSVLALVLCFTMLIGTTFAWFTDSVTSANNIIKSGNLDVELYYKNDTATEWTKVTADTNIFKQDTLWEPGHTEVVKLKVANEGSLALKYQLGINIASEVGSVNKAGEEFQLSDYIYFGVVDGDKTYDRAAAVAAVKDNAVQIKTGITEADALLGKKDSVDFDELTMVVYMPETVGNEANYAAGAAVPTINLGLNLFATQYTSEKDSFDEFYDKAAPWTGTADTDWYFANPDAAEFTLESAEELAGLAAIVNGEAEKPSTTFSLRQSEKVKDDFKGQTIYLNADVDLRESLWTPIGNSEDNVFRGIFDGQGHTVSNLKVHAYGWAGFIGHAGKYGSATIKNLNVEGVKIDANRLAGAVVGQLYGNLENCHVKHATIKVVPNAVDDGYDNGDKVGGVVGWLGDNGENRSLTNCSATDIEITAYRDAGGIVGYVAYSTTLDKNAASNVNITIDQITNYYGDKDFNAGAIWGRHSSSGSVGIYETNSSSEEISVASKYKKGGLEYRQDGVTKETTLYKVPAEIEQETITIPEGVTAIGGYAFAYNGNIETIVLPSSVTTLNDRAFRDTSASTVVLNEGLKNISYQAFRNATNVKSVVIPSTVETIGKEAFQNSGIKELTIPATVKTIEYGGMRDMKELEKVTIEGNVEIPVYAFRACTKLKTVVLKGDDVTFGGKGMIFTNKENGDGSAITMYVANETVKERLLASDTAAKDYGGYKIIVE